MADRRLGWVMLGLGVVTAVWAAAAIPARATYGALTTADEPQYLLTAMSLADDGDLDIADEIATRRYEPFHELTLDPQTEVLADGSQVSPHDPMLPLLLAPAFLVSGGSDSGWVLAKLTLALVAGALAASLLWVAVRRFDVGVGRACLVVGAFALTPPLVGYGSQVYPELPAALALTWGIALATSRLEPRHLAGVVAAVTALPWLGVKYAPVAAALAIVVAVRLRSSVRWRALAVTGGVLVVSGVLFLVAHRLLYGGWTVYAAGDHFAQTGELSVVGSDPAYAGRTRRLVGLLVDRSFGLAAWAPLHLVAVVAVGALLRRRPAGWVALVLPLGAGWATATWVALTMHGWWWPGRQVVVVVPCLVLATAWAVEALPRPRLLPWVVGGATFGLVAWAWLVAEVIAGDRTLVVDFAATANPLYRAWSRVLPDGMRAGSADDLGLAVWAVVLVLLAVLGWRSASAPPLVGGDEDAGAGELADPDVLALDLDGDRAVG